MKFRPEFLIFLAMVVLVTATGLAFNFNHFEHAAAHQGIAQNAAAQGIADISSFDNAVAWVKRAGYIFMFIAMIVEGPIVTAAAAFGAALGYFNIFIVAALAVLGDLVADVIYYGVGYFGRVRFAEKYGHHVGLTERRLKHMERLIRRHPKKTLAAIKLAPFLVVPGLMMVGAVRMPIPRYTSLAFIISLPKVIVFAILGFYFGHAYDHFSKIFENGEYFILIVVATTVLAFYAYKKASGAFAEQLEAI